MIIQNLQVMPCVDYFIKVIASEDWKGLREDFKMDSEVVWYKLHYTPKFIKPVRVKERQKGKCPVRTRAEEREAKRREMQAAKRRQKEKRRLMEEQRKQLLQQLKVSKTQPVHFSYWRSDMHVFCRRNLA